MPRRSRCVVSGVPYHITQRGVDKCVTFSGEEDRQTYLRLLRDNLSDAEVRLLGWCMMTNHVHLIAIPGREDSLAILFRRVHGRYAQYYNARSGRTGHLWQNRFFACSLGVGHLWTALAYVERNPVRAGLVASEGDYRWSSAVAHLTEVDEFQLIDMEWWETSGVKKEWPRLLNCDDSDAVAVLRASTYAGRPFGDDAFMTEIGARFGRQWNRGRPRKDGVQKTEVPSAKEKKVQFSLF
jgi:putative transposase